MKLEYILSIVEKYGKECFNAGVDMSSTFERYKNSIDNLNNAKSDMLTVIKSIVEENDFNKTHTLIECPQCGFRGGREYEPATVSEIDKINVSSLVSTFEKAISKSKEFKFSEDKKYEETISLFASKFLKE
jgi:hypothetical protein